MDELYFSVNTDRETTLCLAPLSDRQIALSGEEIDDASGYFLFERTGNGDSSTINILARVTSIDAVERMRTMLALA